MHSWLLPVVPMHGQVLPCPSITHLLGSKQLMDMPHLVVLHPCLQDPLIAWLEGGHSLVGQKLSVTSMEVTFCCLIPSGAQHGCKPWL